MRFSVAIAVNLVMIEVWVVVIGRKGGDCFAIVVINRFAIQSTVDVVRISPRRISVVAARCPLSTLI